MSGDQTLATDEIVEAIKDGGEQPSKAVLIALMNKYGLTYKQASYVYQTMLHPEKPALRRGEAAGYAIDGIPSNGYGTLNAAKTVNALTDLTERQAAIERKSKELVRAIETDARAAIRGELAIHAADATIVPNQTRALELLGKMEGVFIDRIELDPGEHTRGRFAEEMIIKAKTSGEED